MTRLRESIRPSSDIRNKYPEISKQCREDREAVIITVNGRSDTVSMGYDDYQRMNSRIELLETLIEAQDDVDHGRVAAFSDSVSNLKTILKGMK